MRRKGRPGVTSAVAVSTVWVMVFASGIAGPGVASDSESREEEKAYVTGGVHLMDCDIDAGLGGVCFRVPADLEEDSGVWVTVDDFSGQKVGGLVEVGNGIFLSEWFCGEWVGPVVPGGTLQVYLDVPGVDEACTDSTTATVGSVTATYFPASD